MRFFNHTQASTAVFSCQGFKVWQTKERFSVPSSFLIPIIFINYSRNLTKSLRIEVASLDG
uniref:Uncharacterized protein B3gp7 n=1 Tax=Wolbachia endosymbiont of Cadra cautella TaxID=190193 RepID=B9A8Z5_9RICK|nr:hypothetical protein [Wolbachia endosymbiont of Cadra cautella]